MLSSPQVNLYGDDVERLAAFYGAVGFAETFRTPPHGAPIHVELVLDGLRLGIASAASAAADHGLDVRAGARGAEVCLWSDDLDADHARVLGLGGTALVAPKEWLGRLRVAWVADPEGNPVELVQSLGQAVG